MSAGALRRVSREEMTMITKDPMSGELKEEFTTDPKHAVEMMERLAKANLAKALAKYEAEQKSKTPT